MTLICNETMPFFGYSMTWRPYPIKSPMWLHNLVTNVYLYLTPVCLLIGTLGNILCIIVFLRPAMSSLASRNRFILISVMDITILYGSLFLQFLRMGNFFVFCDLETEFVDIWLQTTLRMMDAWILALVTLERALAIFRPLSTWTNNENRKNCCSWINSILIALPFISSFLCLPALFAPILQMSLLARFSSTISNVNTVLSTIVPFILMLCLDVAILIKLYSSPLSGFKKEKQSGRWINRIKSKVFKRKAGSLQDSLDDIETGNDERTETARNRAAGKKRAGIERAGNNHVTANRNSARARALQSIKMILAVDIVAIVLNLPFNVLLILQIKHETLVNAARFTNYFRHTINFLFYLIGSQFRRETVAVLCCRFHRPQSTGVSTINVSTVTSKVDM